MQRSGDGVHFETVNKIIARHGTGGVHTYSYIDKQPRNGLNYYWLQQVDKDGSLNYPAIVTVHFINGTAFSIYPNPCIAKRMYVEDRGSCLQQVLITGIAGRKVLVRNINNAATLHDIDVAALKSGVYFVGLYSKGV